jgi:hypothetical protein
VSSITGSRVLYAGGGGGGGYLAQSEPAGLGGTGADGGYSGYAITGLANTGSGGGGGGNTLSIGASGGSGIVVLRYPSYLKQAASTTGSPTYYQALGYNVYIFYASGTITF